MKIYKVNPDTNYSFLYPEDKIYKSEKWDFNGKPLIEVFPKTFNAWFDTKDNDPIPDIAYMGMMTFAFRKDVGTELADIIEAAGEALPFYVGDELWYCLNVTTIADAVDETNSTYEVDEGGMKFGLIKPTFNIDKIPKSSSLFKIPSDNFTTIYCTNRRDTDEDVLSNFFCAVARHKYTGVKFVEIYDSEG